MNLPELPRRLGRVLRELGGSPRVAVGDGGVPKDVPHAVAEPAPQVRRGVMDGAEVTAGVAALLDQRDYRVGGTQDAIAADVDRGRQLG